MWKLLFFGVLLLSSKLSNCHTAKDFDDSILYNIEWTDEPLTSLDMLVTFPPAENCICQIPSYEKSEIQNKDDFELTTFPMYFLSSIFSSTNCNIRIEAYWTYEICHGHHVKQFHEERDGKISKVQEYYLGKWSFDKIESLHKQFAETKSSKETFKLNTVKIENVNFPFFEIDMSDGTFCELNGQPRSVKVRYVCFPNKNNEIYTIKETSTCNYELIVLTSQLCVLPAFNTDKSEENTIKCRGSDNLGKAPNNVLLWNLESYKNMQERVLQATFNVGFSSILDKLVQPRKDEVPEVAKVKEKIPLISTSPKGTSPIKDFLTGSNCLTGGSGWWRYEFCFGLHVRQVHYEKNVPEISVILGYYDNQAHKTWLAKNPDKKPKPKENRNEVSHFYQGGDVCDKTNEKRQTEVKLKCLSNSTTQTSVSMYLLEPKTCHYILVVESPIICEILPLVDDEEGIIPPGVLATKFGIFSSDLFMGTEQIHIEFD